MNYDNRFNKFLITNSEIKKNHIANYKFKVFDKSLIEYSCNKNKLSWIKKLKNYYQGDLLEYYTKNDEIDLRILKLLFKKYNYIYMQNIILYSKNLKAIEFFLYFDNKSSFCFNLVLEIENKELVKLFLKYGYNPKDYEIEILVLKNIIFEDLYYRLYEWILNEKKNVFCLFKYCNCKNFLHYLELKNFNFNRTDEENKDILMYVCNNINVDLEFIKSLYKLFKIDYDVSSVDICNHNALYYYCLNNNFKNEIFDFLIEKNFVLNKFMIHDLLDHNLGSEVLKKLENFDIDILPFKYDFDLLSENFEILKYYDQKFGLYDYIDLDDLIVCIIEFENYKSLRYIIDKYPEQIEIKDKYNNSILDMIVANREKDVNIINYLVDKGIDVYNKNLLGNNCIFNLLESVNRDLNIFGHLLKFNKIEFSYNNNLEKLYHLICKLDLDTSYLEVLINTNLNYNLLDKNKNHALNYALINSNFNNSLFFFKLKKINLYQKNNLGCNSLDYFLRSNIFSLKLLNYYKNVSLKNLENYINCKNFDIKVFAYLLSKMNNKYEVNNDGNNILLFICKTYFYNTKTKIRILNLLKNFKFNFNKINKKKENTLILTMKYDQNYYVIKYLLKLKVSTFCVDKYGNNALMYSKNLKIYNLLSKFSKKRINYKKQNILMRIFDIGYLNKKFILELSKHYTILKFDRYNNSVLDYFINNNNTDVELFDFILKFLKLSSRHINNIFKSYNNRLCIYLLHKNLISIDYQDFYKYGILDYFSFDDEIFKFVLPDYKYKIKNKNAIITNKGLLKFIDDIDYYIFNTDDMSVRKEIIKNYKLNTNTKIKLLNQESLFTNLLDTNMCLNFKDSNHNNILIMILIKKYKLENIKLLIEKNIVDINFTNLNGRNALYFAYYDINVFKYLIDKGCNYDILDNNLESLLYDAVKKEIGYYFIEYLIKDCKLDANHKDIFGQSIIFNTTNYQILKILLKNGINKNTRDLNGNTYLNYYVQKNDIEIRIIDLLIKYNFNFNTINNNHCTPLINYLKFNDSIFFLSVILKFQNSINLQDITGSTALHISIRKGLYFQVIHLLLDYDCNLNILDNYNKNCLFYCNSDSYLPIIKKLMLNGIDYNLIVDCKNYIMYCCWWNMESTVKYLINNYSNINKNHLDFEGNNLLFYTTGVFSEQGNLSLLKYLVNQNININHINNNGQNLLFIAAGVTGYNYYDYDIMKYLLKYIEKSHIDNEGNTFLSYLNVSYFENLIERNDLNINDSIVLEQIYSQDIKHLIPLDLEFKFKEMKEHNCGICLENFKLFDIINECPNKHTFHRECLIKWYQESQKTKCPYCTLRFTLDNKCIKCL
jgi:uncharacterized protein